MRAPRYQGAEESIPARDERRSGALHTLLISNPSGVHRSSDGLAGNNSPASPSQARRRFTQPALRGLDQVPLLHVPEHAVERAWPEPTDIVSQRRIRFPPEEEDDRDLLVQQLLDLPV